MPTEQHDVTPRAAARTALTDVTTGAVMTAIVDDISPDGVARIVVSGEQHPRTAASALTYSTAAEASAALLGQLVVVVFAALDMPVIVGPVRRRLWEARERDTGGTDVRGTLPTDQPVAVEVDRQRRIELEAADEIRLTCGKSALVMRRDGTVIVRGVKIVSRATETNRIMGGTVGIN
ncbi:MAG: hypothetical protein U0P82_17745 [Vicinamibacterales bacterium]